MRLLLDTHIWIWSVLSPTRLVESVAAELDKASNEIWLSPISTWELTNLVRKKKVLLQLEPEVWIPGVLRTFPYKEAPMNHDVALESYKVDLPHWDPADRILAATAVVYELTLVTADQHLLRCKRLMVLPNR